MKSHAFKQYIENNRQTGTTTALVKIAIEVKGDIVVGNMNDKNRLLKQYPELHQEHVYTCAEINNLTWNGHKPSPIFFDTDAIWQLLTNVQRAPPLPWSKSPVVIENCTFANPNEKVILSSEADGTATIAGGITMKGNVIIDGSLTVNDNKDHKNDEQLNIKLTKTDDADIEQIRTDFFEGEASRSMVGRFLIRKGIRWYKNLLK